MIKISTRVLYGLRAIIYMGLNKDKWPVSLSEIANYQNIPLRYIEQIFIRFRKANIVKSIRGVKGGYILKNGFEDITLLEIVESADSKIIPVWCLNPNSKKKCPIVEDCILVDIWAGLGKNIRDYLGSIRLGDILKKAKETDFVELIRKMSLGSYHRS
ncbi:MAG: Rrf2 family transcriptional regulator [Brevinematales bacterium]|nr:Rrf2 family transcriptional regulator [Brevinematales bacterium]